MGRIRKGSIVEREGKLYAVIQYVDETGRKRGVWRRAQDGKAPRGIIKQVLRDLDDHSATTLDAQNMTLAALATHSEQHYLKAAEYTAERDKSLLRRPFNRKAKSYARGDIHPKTPHDA